MKSEVIKTQGIKWDRMFLWEPKGYRKNINDKGTWHTGVSAKHALCSVKSYLKKSLHINSNINQFIPVSGEPPSFRFEEAEIVLSEIQYH